MTQGGAVEAGIFFAAAGWGSGLHEILAGLASESGRDWRQFAGITS